MNIPIELFLGFVGITFVMIAIGLVRRIPALIVFAGMFMFTIFAITDVIELDSFSQITNSTTTDSTIIFQNNTYHYRVDTGTTSLVVQGGAGSLRTIVAEYGDGTGAIIGDTINCIDVAVRKSGSPTGNADIGVFDSIGTLTTSFGSFDVSTLTTMNQHKTGCLTGSETHTIGSNDRIGVRYTGGDVTNHLIVVIDNTNPFDGTATIRQDFLSGTWSSLTGTDTTARFYLSEEETLGIEGTENTFEIVSRDFVFDNTLKVIFLLFASMVMLVGALIGRID